MFAAFTLDAFDECVHRVGVCPPYVPGLRDHAIFRFEILERRVFTERKRALQRIEDVHHDHFILLVAEVLKRSEDLFRLIEEIAQDDHQAAAADALRNQVERASGCRSRTTPERLQGNQYLLEICPGGVRGQKRGDGLIEEGQSDRILLVNHHVGKRGSKGGGIVQFGDLPRRCECHRPAGVQHQVRLQVCLFLVLLDVEAVGSPVDLPVNVTDLITRHVRPVFRKLHAEAVIGAAMESRNEAFHDQPRPQLHVGQFGDDMGKKICPGGGRHPD